MLHTREWNRKRFNFSLIAYFIVLVNLENSNHETRLWEYVCARALVYRAYVHVCVCMDNNDFTTFRWRKRRQQTTTTTTTTTSTMSEDNDYNNNGSKANVIEITRECHTESVHRACPNQSHLYHRRKFPSSKSIFHASACSARTITTTLLSHTYKKIRRLRCSPAPEPQTTIQTHTQHTHTHGHAHTQPLTHTRARTHSHIYPFAAYIA